MKRAALFSFTTAVLLAACMDSGLQPVAPEHNAARSDHSVPARSGTVMQKPSGEMTLFSTGLTTQDLTQGLTPQDLAQALVGEGVTVSNVTYTGAPSRRASSRAVAISSASSPESSSVPAASPT
jgi:hypothetical protein